MNLDKIKIVRKQKPKLKRISLNIRITPEQSKWLKDKDYSPSAIFNEALKDLGYKAGAKKLREKPKKKKRR